MYNKIKQLIIKCIAAIVKSINSEDTRKVKVRFIILLLLSVILFLATNIIFFGILLMRKIIIKVPDSDLILSEEDFKLMRNLAVINYILQVYVVITAFNLIYKEYRNYQFHKTVKLYKLDMIK